MPRSSLVSATEELARRDPDLAALVGRVGHLTWRPRQPDAFSSLVRAIVYQQLATRAASAIHGRFLAAVATAQPTPASGLTPAAVLATPEPALRGAGLSAAKAASVRDLAAHVLDGRVDLDHLSRLSDDEIVARLSGVRGIGPWTTQMFLIFQLRRLDVWPTGDLGVRSGYAVMHALPAPPSPRQLETLGEAYVPYRSVAAVWCWEAVHEARRAGAGR